MQKEQLMAAVAAATETGRTDVPNAVALEQRLQLSVRFGLKILQDRHWGSHWLRPLRGAV